MSISTLLNVLRKRPTIAPAPKPLNSHQQCEFSYGGVRCTMRRTTYGKFCTLHRP